MTDQEWTDAELIIARCATVDDLSSQVARHAKIVLYLVCDLCQKNGQTELGIRWLYRVWAEMAVEEFRSPRGPGPAN